MDVIIKKCLLIIILGLIFTVSCESDVSDEDCETYDYVGCNTLEPYEAEVALKFTIKDNEYVPFEIIKGRVENGTTIVYDTANVTEIVYILEIPQYYTVKAKYKNGNTTIYAIDGVEMKANDVKKCDSVCWEMDDFRLDMTLKK